MITGAARGIGRAIAEKLASAGADLALADLRNEDLAATQRICQSHCRRIIASAVDVSRPGDVDAWVAATVRVFGRIDILVNDAGIADTTPFLDITLESWERMLTVNLTGTFLCSQAVARRMVEENGGKIINVASIAGRTGRPLAAHYAASKAGVISLSRSMALALAKHNVTVNAVCPGITDTPMWEQLDEQKARLFGLPKGEALRQAIAEVPLGRAAMPDDIAELVLFLAGPKADYITGQALNVCGGLDRD
ncbi:MAG: hypothetical protein DMG07_06640 [Acidobacteria bacterium]|nr:MAG: hypothetical protein DMG07_06640 [Acidobacteriota bacterium]